MPTVAKAPNAAVILVVPDRQSPPMFIIKLDPSSNPLNVNRFDLPWNRLATVRQGSELNNVCARPSGVAHTSHRRIKLAPRR